jgi:hypothetical protein
LLLRAAAIAELAAAFELNRERKAAGEDVLPLQPCDWLAQYLHRNNPRLAPLVSHREPA